MPPGPRLRPAVFTAREKLAAGRSKLRLQHDRGSPGIQVCARLTELVDDVVLDLFRSALAATDETIASQVALTAIGGYGRRDVAPFSDVDLMLLVRRGAGQKVAPLARLLTQDICDAGLDLGFSLRSPSQACSWAMRDPTIFTSLVEARFLGGAESLFHGFARSFRRIAQRRWHGLIEKIEESRRGERRQYGETVYLLEPNVKRSQGGLRDVHLLRWIGFARYGQCDPESLARSGLLSKNDQSKLRKAHEFLLRLRNEMHFHAGRSHDLLTKDEQLRIAELFGYEGDERLLPVERFLRDYIEHTNQVRFAVAHFLASAKARVTALSLVPWLFSHRVGGEFLVDPVRIRATRRGLEKVGTDLAEVLRLMDLANRYRNRIDHHTWVTIRDAMTRRTNLAVSSEAVKRFLSLISQPGRLGDLLRRLHELRALEKIIPPMAHARGLMQFNEYHKYTVDEHSIRAVEHATSFLDMAGPLGDAYRSLRDKSTLHLALLLHDLGKGHAEDHSEVGQRLALQTAAHLGLPAPETEKLSFLVHKHLLMSHLAQRRDISDDTVVVQFAVQVGSPELLQMLYVLTCADLAAVGPGVLNSWRLDLITRLYLRTREHLAGDTATINADAGVTHQRAGLAHLVADDPDQSWWKQQIASLPRSYVVEAAPHEIIDILRHLKQLPHDEAIAWGRYHEPRKAVEYSVGTYEEITPGIFHKLTGALSSKGLQILSAEIQTLSQKLVLDRFYVLDADFAGEPPRERLEDVSQALVAALKSSSGQTPTFRRLWSEGANRGGPSRPHGQPTQVRVDNNTSERYTILDIFAHDRMGLLYTITRTIFELGLSVHVAKIGTYLDQVVDVFYVTDDLGRKMEDEQLLRKIQQRLIAEIEAFDPDAVSTPQGTNR
jgi:[protein-PII] uridylyltransferase